jgi:succinyl-CoA synthetase alpha subunit
LIGHQEKGSKVSILADQNMKVIVQGITGRETASFTKDMLDYRINVVAGVTPGKQGQQIHGVPVYDTIRRAVRDRPAEASVISVPPGMVKGAALEALENGIKLLVIVTERVPRKDVIEFLEVAQEKMLG